MGWHNICRLDDTGNNRVRALMGGIAAIGHDGAVRVGFTHLNHSKKLPTQTVCALTC
ncbi:hypothetical protein Ssi03_37790 [Sphaerisporangium siamense]|uniref:Uncharacterized protein n=1 Tax=Sphaerisporangium siamense TaxID=795645 RepID=A0A7W7GBK1_9ACTN|nr:hypothetical protein [Sphaerisporangium siamense]GII85789.1 hypothetical protein Ssi03_37790 [Sphaerisporangium siamense]